MVTVADLVVRLSADPTEAKKGLQETQAGLKSVQEQAEQATRALEIMATQMSKSGQGGTAAGWLDILQRTGAQPTAAAMAEAAKQAEKTSAAMTSAVGPTQAVARAAADAIAPTQAASKATTELAGGWNASESSMVRFGASLVGINLGISLIAGAARLVHDVIADIVTSQLDWERSLVTLSGLYGQTGGQAAALANAQANLPGVLGTQQEFAQARLNASGLNLRYGVSQGSVDQMITTGGRMAYATGMTDPAQREQLQAQLLAAAQTGAPLPPQYGIYTDPEAVARSLGGAGAQSLQAYTPQEVMTARTAIVNSGGSQFADRAGADQRAALDAVTATSKALDEAKAAVQTNLERTPAAGAIQGPTQAERSATQSILEYGQTTPLAPPQDTPYAPAPTTDLQQAAADDAQKALTDATTSYAAALVDSAKVQADAQATFERLSQTADAAGAHLLSFFGSLEDPTSLAHGDILAQAQGAVTARARSAMPVLGMGAAEIGAIGTGTGWQQAWQNYTAGLAQQEQTNAIQRNLQQRAGAGYPVGAEGPGLAPSDRAAAQGAIDQGARLGPINAQIGTATTRGALVDLQTAQTQAQLQTISLTQQERQVQLLRDTVDLRKLDVQQQQASLAATMNVVRAQQAGLPAQYAQSDAQYTTSMASSLAQQRMGRVLQGRDVSGLPSIDQLIQMNVQGQFATAEAGPAALQAGRGIELAQRTATSAGLAEQLTSGQIQSAGLEADLKNLGDLPTQTGLQLELITNNRDQLTVQKDLRDLTKQLVQVMTGAPATGGQSTTNLLNQVGAAVFGDGSGDTGTPAPSTLPGARRGS